VHQFGIGRRVNSDGLDALFLTGAQDPQRDLARLAIRTFCSFFAGVNIEGAPRFKRW
jgi:hypothetical protein